MHIQSSSPKDLVLPDHSVLKPDELAQLIMRLPALLFALLAVPIIAADDGEDFSSNLFSDLAP